MFSVNFVRVYKNLLPQNSCTCEESMDPAHVIVCSTSSVFCLLLSVYTCIHGICTAVTMSLLSTAMENPMYSSASVQVRRMTVSPQWGQGLLEGKLGAMFLIEGVGVHS